MNVTSPMPDDLPTAPPEPPAPPTPEPEPEVTLDEWIAATQSCCGVDRGVTQSEAVD